MRGDDGRLAGGVPTRLRRAIGLLALAASLCLATDAVSADAAVKPPALTSPWEVAFGGGVYSDYVFRGISQTKRQPSVNSFVEPRYRVNDSLQLYAGFGGWSVSYPNRAPTELDFYGGIRPGFGPVELDLGVWYFYYPGGQCFSRTVDVNGRAFGTDCFINGNLPINGNTTKADISYLDFFAKATWKATDQAAIGGVFNYDPDWANSGAYAIFAAGTIRLTVPSSWMPPGLGAAVSAEIGRQWFGATDAFSCTSGTARAAVPAAEPAASQCGGPVPPAFPVATPYPNGTPLPGYATWNIGLSVTFNAFTLDFRYFNTTLNPAECNALTGDINATFNRTYVSALNPSGFGSNLCGQSFLVSLAAEAAYGINK